MPAWPFRLLLAGPPGVGKRNMLLNLIFRLEPPPTAIHIVHCDPETPEYEELETLGVPMYYWAADDFPSVDEISAPEPAPVGEQVAAEPDEDLVGDVATGAEGDAPLVILDEITTEMLNLEGRSRLERLMNFGSTHRNASVCYSIQAVTNVPPKARRAFNQFCLWKQPDEQASTMAATRAGVPPAMLQELFGLCQDRHDSIWIDCDQHPDSPWRFRLNFLTPITATSAVNFSDY
jgi:DNA polymerase III delta prime subunit